MHTGRYWDPVTKEHTSDGEPGERAYSALPLDWDGDGDFDLIVGTDKGGLFLRENEGTKTRPLFARQNVALRAGSTAAVVPSGYAMPVAADWDGDGRWDLVSGSLTGAVYWFRNVGPIGWPMLEPPRTLVARPDAGEDGPGRRSQVAVADFDGDGDMDLLVGDNRSRSVDDDHARHGFVWLYRRVGARLDTQPAAGAGNIAGPVARSR